MRSPVSSRRWPELIALLLFAGTFARPALAQCPDGSPPPCRTQVAAATPRPSPRALDARTWIVLPFANVTREPEVEWLREASVNLLYLGLSRWQDIRVIDDERVSDLLQGLPTAQREVLGLNGGLTLARQVGAGRLVMGDLMRSGARTTVVAKVYDVTDGRRLRTVSEEIPVRDSTMPAYSRLAGRVLGASLPQNASREAVGTSSLNAYQAYAAGLQALNSWQLDTAQRYLRQAIAHDSAFALARYKLSVTLGWLDASRRDEIIEHAEAAVRSSSGLPARERALIRGQQGIANSRYAEACSTFRGLVAADSLDMEAWYQLGECSFHDPTFVDVSADSTSARFNGDWNTAYIAFNRALQLDPSMHLAYEHLLDMLRGDIRGYCLNPQCSRGLGGPIEVRNDSIIIEARFPDPSRIPASRTAEARRARLDLASSIAQRWLSAAPDQQEAHWQYALVLQRMKRFSHAASEVATTRRLGGRRNPILTQVHLLVSADSVNNRTLPQAVQLADSALRNPPPLQTVADPQGAAAQQADRVRTYAVVAGTLGRFSRIGEDLLRSPFQNWAEPAGFHRARIMLAAGVLPPNLDTLIARMTGPEASAPIRRNSPALFGALCFGLCSPRGVAQDSIWRTWPLGLLAARDTAAARTKLHEQDSVLAATDPERIPAQLALLSAAAHLALSDTAGTIRALSDFERIRPTEAFFIGGPGNVSAMLLLGRAWLLHADLLKATGLASDSYVFYRRVVDLWSGGEREVQPFVERARSALPPGYLN